MRLALATALAMFLACTLFAQGGRKVYISVDMGGYQRHLGKRSACAWRIGIWTLTKANG